MKYSKLFSFVSTGIAALAMVSLTSTVVEGGEQEAVSAYQAGDFTTAAKLWQQEFDTNNDINGKIVALSNLASTYLKLNQVNLAQGFVDQNLELISSQGKVDALVYAQASLIAGNVSERKGNTKVAVEHWNNARDAYQTRDMTGLVKANLNLVKGYSDLGLYNRLSKELDRLELVTDEIEDIELLSRSLLAMGNAYQLIGRNDQAELRIQQAIELDPSPSSKIALANLYKYRGDYDAAQAQLDSIVTRRNASTDVVYQTGLQKMQLALHQEQWSKAAELGMELQASKLPTNNTTLRWQFEAVDGLIETASNSRKVDLDSIKDHLAQLKIKAGQLGSDSSKAQADYQLARILLIQRDYDGAIGTAQQSISTEPLVENYQAFWVLAQSYQAQGNYNKAIEANRRTIEIINHVKGDLVSNPEFQFQFQTKTRPIYDNLVSMLIDYQTPSQADLTIARDTIESLQLVELENYFRLACLETEAKQIDNIDPTASAIYPIFLEDRVVTIASLPDGKLAYDQQDLSRWDAKRTIAKLRSSFNPAIPAIKRRVYSQKVYNWLVEPFLAEFDAAGVETLAFVPNGELRNIPLGAIEDDQGKFLVQNFNVAIAPGLSLLRDKEPQTKKIDSIIISGLSDAQQGFIPLPGVEKEVNSIANLDYKSKVLLNEGFNNAELGNQLKRNKAGAIHIATHGQFSSDLDDTFILSWNNRINVEKMRGLLRSRAESGNASAIELLVLSACETAVGDERAALGLAGIAVRSGARSTLASLWQVNDGSTSDLMADFYTELRQDNSPQVNRAEALRKAQVALIESEEYNHPYYWAPFVMIGNWI